MPRRADGSSPRSTSRRDASDVRLHASAWAVAMPIWSPPLFLYVYSLLRTRMDGEAGASVAGSAWCGLWLVEFVVRFFRRNKSSHAVSHTFQNEIFILTLFTAEL